MLNLPVLHTKSLVDMRTGKLVFFGRRPQTVIGKIVNCAASPLDPSLLDTFIRRYSDNNSPNNFAWAGDNFGPADWRFLTAMCLAISTPMYTYQTGGKLLSEARQIFEKTFANVGSSEKVAVFFVPTGTASNQLSLSPFIRPVESIIAAENSHMLNRENGAYHTINNSSAYGIKINTQGKIDITALRDYFDQFDKNGRLTYAGAAIPRVISISQPTEYGTIYTDDEVKELADLAHKRNMLLQVDGARLFYVAAATGKTLKQLTTDLGIDIVSLGGSKNKMVMAESIVYTPSFFHQRPEFTPDGIYNLLRKYAKQVGCNYAQTVGAAAQFTYALDTGHTFSLMKKAVDTAHHVEEILKKLPDTSVMVPTETNIVMMSMPRNIADAMQAKYKLMVLDGKDPMHPDNVIVRFMTNASNTKQDLEEFQVFVEQLCSGSH